MLAYRAPARLFGSHLMTKLGAGPSSLAMCALAGLFSLLVLGAPAHGQSAQANWWESLTGSGTPDYTGRRQADRRARPGRAARRAARRPAPRRHADAQRRDDRRHGCRDRHYQQIADNGGWPVIPAGRMMREGEDDERVPLLRRRLRMSGDSSAAQARRTTRHTFDSDLTDAVRRYQRRNGLRPDRPRRALDLSRAQHDGRRAHCAAAYEPRAHSRADGRRRPRSATSSSTCRPSSSRRSRSTRCNNATASSSGAPSARRLR